MQKRLILLYTRGMPISHTSFDEKHPLVGGILDEFETRAQPEYYPHGDPYFGHLNGDTIELARRSKSFAKHVINIAELCHAMSGNGLLAPVFVNRWERVHDMQQGDTEADTGYPSGFDIPGSWFETLEKSADSTTPQHDSLTGNMVHVLGTTRAERGLFVPIILNSYQRYTNRFPQGANLVELGASRNHTPKHLLSAELYDFGNVAIRAENVARRGLQKVFRDLYSQMPDINNAVGVDAIDTFADPSYLAFASLIRRESATPKEREDNPGWLPRYDRIDSSEVPGVHFLSSDVRDLDSNMIDAVMDSPLPTYVFGNVCFSGNEPEVIDEMVEVGKKLAGTDGLFHVQDFVGRKFSSPDQLYPHREWFNIARSFTNLLWDPQDRSQIFKVIAHGLSSRMQEVELGEDIHTTPMAKALELSS